MPYATLVDSVTLRRHLGERGWRVFDCRASAVEREAGERAYREGHVPGARHADLDRVLASAPVAGSGRHPLPDASRLAAWFGEEGVGANTQIVAYDEASGAFAARLWWLARWLGHAATAVLDGGFAAWRETGGAAEAGIAAKPAAQAFEVRPALVSVADTADVLRIVAGQTPGVLVDARTVPRYRGESEPIDPVAGHIPGAHNRPFADNLARDGRFLPPEALRRRFAGLADGGAFEVVHYCGSGVTAAHNLLAMEHAGLHGSRLYAGSWSEWIADRTRPVARDG
jgi:thiosulfate/3-mercaptopyruvate sulfurtransferase